MGRIRTIKPEFFTDQDLAELAAFERLLFIGLWTEADRLGRLEDKPETLRVRLLPFDDVNVDRILTSLADKGFIRRFVVKGRACIDIPTFTTHQRCNLKEPQSRLPGFEEADQVQATIRHVPTGNPARAECVPTAQGREGKGREGKGKEPDAASPPPPPVFSEPGSLREQLDAAHRDVRKAAYRWTADHERALIALLATESEAEIVRRWRIALARKFPYCRGIPDLVRDWNAYAQPDATAPPGKVGRATNAEKDWDNATVNLTPNGDIAL